MSAKDNPLKTCPFCGSEPGTLARPDNIDGTEFYAAVFCHCDGYSATAHVGRRRKTQDEATAEAQAAWNKRAAAQPMRQPLTIEQIDALAMDSDGFPNTRVELTRAIERAHGIGDAAGNQAASNSSPG